MTVRYFCFSADYSSEPPNISKIAKMLSITFWNASIILVHTSLNLSILIPSPNKIKPTYSKYMLI